MFYSLGIIRSAMYGGNDDSRPLQDGNDNFAFSEKSIRMGKTMNS